MSVYSRILILLLLLSGAAFSLDRNAFSFTNYDLELRANPEEQMIAVRGKITLRNDSDKPQSQIALQISSTLDWRMIELNGGPVEHIVETYNTDIDHTGKVTEAVITLPSPVAPKGTVELEVGYNGTIPQDATRLTRIGMPQANAVSSDWDRVSAAFTAVRGAGHVVWYPVAANQANLSEHDLSDVLNNWQVREASARMTTKLCWITDEDHSYSVVSNGSFESMNGADGGEGNRAGCSTYSYTDLGQDVPAFAIGQFEMLTRPIASLYYLAGHQEQASDYAAATERVLPQVQEWFGSPKEKVQVIELPEAEDASFESGAMLFTPFGGTTPKQVEMVMAHQLTHAAFHSPRPWINEGLAHFMQALVRERQDGHKAALDFLATQLPALQAVEKFNLTSSKGAGPQALTSTTDEVYYRTKAMFVWWMLRDMLGDHALETAIKNYQPSQDKDAAYMPRLVSAQTKRDLQWFFSDWVDHDRGLPDFKIDGVNSLPPVKDSSVVAITIENTGDAAAEVPVRIVSTGGEQTVRVLAAGHQKATTRLTIPGKPTNVELNDDSVPESDMDNNGFKLPQ